MERISNQRCIFIWLAFRCFVDRLRSTWPLISAIGVGGLNVLSLVSVAELELEVVVAWVRVPPLGRMVVVRPVQIPGVEEQILTKAACVLL
jgi:hypothetical protein